MEQLEFIIQKYIINFCKILPSHVEKWRTILLESTKPASALVNYAEQLRHVERCNIKYIDEFTILQQDLLYKIYTEIEYETSILHGLIDQLNKTNQDIRNKLTVLEKATIELNWESSSAIVVGSALQPPLKKILQNGLNFCLYFANALKSINENFRNHNAREEKSMNCLKASLNIDLEKPVVTVLLAITQYINNEKLLIV